MHTVGMTWPHAEELAAVLMASGAALALARNRHVRTAGAFARETSVIAALYGLWQLAGKISVTGTGGAMARARWIDRFDRHLFVLPDERTTQQLFLGHHLLIQGFNYYYASMHFTTMGLFLLWLFVRHRERYRPIRQVMAWTTLGCLVVQLAPVAPPRMLPGVVDTAMRYGQSVYSNGLAIDQLSSMPSVHVAWAALIGYYVWRVSPSRWRWIGPFHAVLMTLIVVVTGNHWWLDGIVAVAILIVVAWAVAGWRALWRAGRAHWGGAVVTGSEPVNPALAAV